MSQTTPESNMELDKIKNDLLKADFTEKQSDALTGLFDFQMQLNRLRRQLRLTRWGLAILFAMILFEIFID